MTHKEKVAIAFAINALTGKYTSDKNRMMCLRDKKMCEGSAEVLMEMLRKENK